MTATLTAPAAPATRGPRGLVWALVQVHRMAFAFWAVALIGATAGLIWMYAIGDTAREGNVPWTTSTAAGSA
jgi:hypothetical protein